MAEVMVNENSNAAIVNSVKVYLKGISQYTLLTKEEEVELAKAAAKGNQAAKEREQIALIEAAIAALK